uniref:Uncharacterized protein n=1 Tax=Medicago truncatula TaxID=3880 RepID=I3SMH4_MEDTR|nr:unknown [Medicago truncatula]
MIYCYCYNLCFIVTDNVPLELTYFSLPTYIGICQTRPTLFELIYLHKLLCDYLVDLWKQPMTCP